MLLALCREPRAHIKVAILTDPRWPVLPLGWLSEQSDSLQVAILTDPGWPVLPGPVLRHGHTMHVAILTDPGWPVLRPAGTTAGGLLPGVAILTEPGWPVLLEWHTCGNRRHARRCDPHRPRMAGAAGNFAIARTAAGGVAILIDPGGPVLRLMTIKYTG